MSLSVSQGEGVTVVTITSNPKSKWPILCQILGNLCFSCSAYFLPNDVNRKIYLHPITILGIMQIIVGILNIVTKILFASWGIRDHFMMWSVSFWLGGVFIISGITTIIVPYCEGFTLFFCIRVFVAILNQFSAVLAMIAIGLYSLDLTCKKYYSEYDNSTALNPKPKMDAGSFPHTRNWNVTFHGSLDAMMIVCAFLQLCANVTFVVVTLGEYVMKDPTDDPQKLLPEENTGDPEC